MGAWLPEHLTAFILLEILVCVTPGPAVMYVVSQAARRGRRAGLSAILGIEAGNVIYYALTAAGLAAVIAASGTAFAVVKWAGAFYLAWLGFAAFRDSFRGHPAPVAGGALSLGSARDGLLIQLANPKAILYFVALLPQFIDTERSVLMQTAVLGAIGCGLEAIVLSAYTFAGAAIGRGMARPVVRRWFDRGVGAMFLGLAALTAAYSRSG